MGPRNGGGIGNPAVGCMCYTAVFMTIQVCPALLCDAMHNIDRPHKRGGGRNLPRLVSMSVVKGRVSTVRGRKDAFIPLAGLSVPEHS